MHRERTTFSRRLNRVFTHRADGVAKAIERQGIRATYELHDRLLSNRSSRDRFGDAPPPLDDLQRSILSDVREHGFSVRSFQELFPEGDRWRELEKQRDRFVASTESGPRGGRRARTCPAGQGVRRTAPELRRRTRPRRPLVRRRLLAPPARPRERVSRDVVEARVRRRLVLGAAARGSRAHLVAALAPRLQRQAPAEGLPLSRRRRRGDGPVPVRGRAASPAAPTQTPGAGSRSASTIRPRRSSRPASPGRPCRRSPGLPARSSSATRRAFTAAGSRPRIRACSRLRRTRRPPRSRR